MVLTSTRLLTAALMLGGLVAMSSPGSATLINVNLGGDTQYDGWDNLSVTNSELSGYPSFPGTSPWPSPIASHTAESGDAVITKVANGAGGGAFPAGEGLYFGGFSETPNTLGGTLGFVDSSPLANANTILLQVELNESFGFDLFNGTAPTLSINGMTAISPTYSIRFERVDTGETFPAPDLGEQPVYLNSWAFQWDIAEWRALNPGVTDITSIGINLTMVQHSRLMAARLDQSSTVFDGAAIPEPGSAVLAVIGLSGLAVLRRRRK